MILTDTGPLVALLDKRDVNHAACADAAVAETRSLKQIFTLDTDFRFYRLADGSVLDIIPPLS